MPALLDRAKEKLGTDQKIAEYLAIPPQNVCAIRKGRQNLTAYQSARLAELVGERWSDHAFEALADKARSPAEKDYWLGKAKELGRAAGLVLVIGLGMTHPNTGHAFTEQYTKHSIHYAHFWIFLGLRLNRRRRSDP